MSKIVEISKIRQQEIKKEEQRMVDINASYAALESAYKYLTMNNLPELKNLKDSIRQKMLELRKIVRNGKRQSKI